MTHRSPPAPERLLAAALTSSPSRAGPEPAPIASPGALESTSSSSTTTYRNKAGLYQATLAFAARAVVDQLTHLPLVGLTAVERLRRLVRGQFDFLLNHPEHTAVLVSAESQSDWADLTIRPLAELLREGQATGFFRDDVDPAAHARLALLLTLGYFALRPLTAAWGEASQWRDRTAELIVRGSSW